MPTGLALKRAPADRTPELSLVIIARHPQKTLGMQKVPILARFGVGFAVAFGFKANGTTGDVPFVAW